MTPDELARLDRVTQTVGAVIHLLRRDLPAIEEFLADQPTRDSERRAALAVVQPIFAAAHELVAAYDRQAGRAAAALLAVREMK
jgi:hypothetical protein